MNKELIAFYRDGAPNKSGHTLEQILGWDNLEWEKCHNHIQWAFPLDEPSSFNPEAPLLDNETIEEFKHSDIIMNNVFRMIDRGWNFFGFNDIPFPNGQPYWWKNNDHNLLRLSRMMKFTNALGLHTEAVDIFSCLEDLERQFPDVVSKVTWEFWYDACFGIAEN